jgi:DNA-binding NtrC family response regulator
MTHAEQQDSLPARDRYQRGTRTGYWQAIDVAVDEAGKQYLRGVIEQTGGNLSEAARVAGISRAYLYVLLQRLGIETEAKPQGHRGNWS